MKGKCRALGAAALLLLALPGTRVSGGERAFGEIFPALGEPGAFLAPGGKTETRKSSRELAWLPGRGLGEVMLPPVLERKPSFITESLKVLAYPAGPVSKLKIYNALNRVGGLKGRVYHSATRKKDIPLFEEASRIKWPQTSALLPDPPDAAAVPQTETIYLKLKDANFGNTYYKAEIRDLGNGLLYTFSNCKGISYGIIPVIKEDRFVAQLYAEPLEEGLLVYSLTGAGVSDFAASLADVPSLIRKRLEVIVAWLVDGVF